MTHVDGSPRVYELVRYYMTDIEMKDTWAGQVARCASINKRTTL